MRIILKFVTLIVLLSALLMSFTYPVQAASGGGIQSGETKSGNIAIEGQQDSYTFSGSAGQGVVIEMSAAAGSSLGTAIYLYRPDGTLETKVVGGSYATRVRIEEHQLEQSGTYTIVATASQAYSTAGTGGYGLSLVLIPGAAKSAQDPDGGDIVSGQTHSASINPQGDTDAFAFQGQKGQGVVIEMSAAAGSSLGTAIYLYRPDGTLETKVVGGSYATRVRIEEHQLEQSGTYTIVATASQAYSTAATGGYGLSLVLIPGAAKSAQDPDGGDIVSGQTHSASINPQGDTDAFAFHGQKGQGVVIEMSAAAGSSLGTAIYLYRPDGTLETRVVGGSYATRVRIEDHQLEQSGTYTIVATASQAYSTAGTGGYGLSLVLVGGAAGPTATHAPTPTPVLTPTPTPSGSWSDSFESYETGSFPSANWTPDANALDTANNYVDATKAYSGSKSLRLYGQVGGCWSAETDRPVNINPPYYIEVKINNGFENLSGCHPSRAWIILREGTSWTNPGRALVTFNGNGKIETFDGMVLGNYSSGVWYSVKVKYEILSSSKVRVSYWINDSYKGYEDSDAIKEEANLTDLDLTAAEGTAWFDDVKVWAAEPAPPEENTIGGSVARLNELSTDPEVIGTNIGLAIATVLVFYLAATVFNSTVKDNYETIQGWLGRASARLRFRRTSTSKTIDDQRAGIKPMIRVFLEAALVAAICALIYIFLDPYFKNALRGSALFLSLFIGITIATLGYEGTQVLMSERRFSVPAAIKIYWIAIVVAGICVGLSKAIHFHPGLIYGFVGAYAALSISKDKRLNKRQQAMTILAGTIVILIVSVSAFFLRELVINQWGGESFGRMLVEDILVAAIVLGLEGLVFALAIPVAFMDGGKLRSWNFWGWFVVAGVIAYVFYWIIINKDGRIQEAASNMKFIAMYLLMGLSLAISWGIWLYFWFFRLRMKRLREAGAAVQTSQTPEQGREHYNTLPMKDAEKLILSSSEEDEKQAA